MYWVLRTSNTDELCVCFTGAGPHAADGHHWTWGTRPQQAGRGTHTLQSTWKKYIFRVFVWSPHMLIHFFFLKAWEKFPFSSLFASLSSINNKTNATLPSQDLVSYASLGFSTLSCLTTPCAINLGVLRIGNSVKIISLSHAAKLDFTFWWLVEFIFIVIWSRFRLSKNRWELFCWRLFCTFCSYLNEVQESRLNISQEKSFCWEDG